jgi:hypothetical protein
MQVIVANIGIAILIGSATLSGVTNNDAIVLIPTSIPLGLLASISF